MKTKPSKPSKKREKSVLNGTNGYVKHAKEFKENPETLLERAVTLLQQSQPEEALIHAERALDLLKQPPSNVDGVSHANDSKATVNATLLVGEINVELGDIEKARDSFSQATKLDPNGEAGPEACLWMAQLSEDGGADSIKWFEQGLKILRREISSLEGQEAVETQILAAEKKVKMANALCSMTEIYMTDLSWEVDAETKCETYVTEALLVAPNSPEPLQTLASTRISQLRPDDARAALTRSMQLWKDLPPEDPGVPEFPTRISLARLLMEVQMASEALEILEGLILQDDQSVEAWYLGGWCLYLIGEEKSGREPGSATTGSETSEEVVAAWKSSRAWLKNSLKLFALVGYEDEPLRDHARELVQALDKELGDEESEDEWEDEAEGEGEDEDGNVEEEEFEGFGEDEESEEEEDEDGDADAEMT